jgi:FKBP-type peptidyl-prolyl cis-trans isomerase SlyD
MADATPTVAADKVVSIQYVLTGDDGSELDRSEDGEPLEYLHGHHNIVPGLEEALVGKDVGAKLTVRVPPEKGYGERVGKPQQIPRSRFPKDTAIEKGTQFFTQGPKGETIPVWVTKVMGPTVTIDLNHPLAGETLNFAVEVVGIREATSEELEHGHVHGPHGHHHHDEDEDEGDDEGEDEGAEQE